MKLSIYNYTSSYKGYYLIYNGLKSSCVILNTKEYVEFKNISCNEIQQKEYHRLGLYVDENYNEVDEVLFSSRVLAAENKISFFRVYTTLACNAKCPYCYENGTVPYTMHLEDADKIVKFIKQQSKDSEEIIIEWFGGEPLLNDNLITYISEKIAKFASKNNIKFWTRMITNGLLFDNKKIYDAIEIWKLKKVQITIDGLKHTYEKIKNFNQENAFENVVNNIYNLLNKKISVTIRLNYNESNYDEIINLIDFLREKFGSYENISVYARRIMSRELDNSLTASEDTDIKILKKLIRCNFIKNVLNTIPRRDNMCIAHSLRSFFIYPDGRLGKCSQAMSDCDFIGSVDDGVDINKIIRWCSPRLENKCLKCSQLPLCNGGCMYEKFLGKNYCFSSKKVLMFKLKYFLKNYVKDLSIK